MEQNQIGNFELQQLLGQGGMASVYRALDTKLQRVVALKVLHPDIGQNEEFNQRFVQEARAVANLDHPNIVRIYVFDHDAQGRYYLVMEYVQGGSLGKYLDTLYQRRQVLNVKEALQLTQQVAVALDYAHQQGMVHRDVKPDNILLKPTSSFGQMAFTALLTDFGLAKLLIGENLVQTAANKRVGTLPYMAPEQFRGTIDFRADLYATGIVLYQLLVGRLPFMPKSLQEAADMHVHQPPPLPTIHRPELSNDLETILLKCIAKDPDQRYQSGRELAQAIHDAMHSGGPLLNEGAVPPDTASLRAYQEQQIKQESRTPTVDQVIITLQGKAIQSIQILSAGLLIGRDPKHDITLPNDKVSRNHARIERQADGAYTIMDLGSTNGTYLDGVRLFSNAPQTWKADQAVTIGDFSLTLKVAK